ncbi:MAG: hypothetical protein KIH64_013305 [Mycobacterium sp.]|nr:hypothetical protein [Mycobacterium sp.]
MKILLGAAAWALLIGGGAYVTAAPAAACPYGTTASDFSGVCVSSGNGSAGVPVAPAQSGAVFGGGPNELPTVDGIPCTPWQLGTCIGLAESAR